MSRLLFDTDTGHIHIDIAKGDDLGRAAKRMAELNRGLLIEDIKTAILTVGLNEPKIYEISLNFLEVFLAMDQKIIEDQNRLGQLMSMIGGRPSESDEEDEDDGIDRPIVPLNESFTNHNSNED